MPVTEIDPQQPPIETQRRPCGCGRSASGFCTGLHALTAEEWDRMLTEDMAIPTPQGDNDATD